jgi:hypothetical protein
MAFGVLYSRGCGLGQCKYVGRGVLVRGVLKEGVWRLRRDRLGLLLNF